MQITLEQVDQVIERTGVSYKEAKVALEQTEGNVLEAIVLLEQRETEPEHVNFSFGQDIIKGIKDIIKKGNITKITLEREGKAFLELPLTVGAIGAVFFPPATMVAIIAALATGCELKIVKDDGEVINVKNVTKDTLDQLKDKFNQATKPHSHPHPHSHDEEKDNCCDCNCEEPKEEEQEENIYEDEEKKF